MRNDGVEASFRLLAGDPRYVLIITMDSFTAVTAGWDWSCGLVHEAGGDALSYRMNWAFSPNASAFAQSVDEQLISMQVGVPRDDMG